MRKKRIKKKECELICQECGKHYFVENYYKDKSKFCSRICSAHASGRKLQKYIWKTTICPVCGKEFKFQSREHRGIKDRIYCSRQCASKVVHKKKE